MDPNRLQNVPKVAAASSGKMLGLVWVHVGPVLVLFCGFINPWPQNRNFGRLFGLAGAVCMRSGPNNIAF